MECGTSGDEPGSGSGAEGTVRTCGSSMEAEVAAGGEAAAAPAALLSLDPQLQRQFQAKVQRVRAAKVSASRGQRPQGEEGGCGASLGGACC